MNTAKHIGRIGALAAALGVGNVRRTTTRVAVSIGAAALVATAAVTAAPVSTTSPTIRLSADSTDSTPLTALLVCGAACPTWLDADVEIIMDQFITPTHPGPAITPFAVTTPSSIWPATGVLRLIGSVTGDPRLTGPGSGLWPDEPWWKLSGLFDPTARQSVETGADNVEAAMAKYGNDHLVIYGYSMGAGVANVVKNRLAAQYPKGTDAPDITFVLGGDPNLPNGGLSSRIPGLYIPILDFPVGYAASTDTQFKTVEINQQYDGASDFPLYPLNVIALLNAGLGFLYLHTHPFDVSLPDNPTTSPAYRGTYGDTDYYFFETQDLPLFAPLRQIGVPESLIDVVEPFFRMLVELGYDRSIDPWVPTPARLIPTTLDPAKVVTDLVDAVGEGAANAAGLFGATALSGSSADAQDAALATMIEAPDTADAGISAKIGSPEPQQNPTEFAQPDESNLLNHVVNERDSIYSAATATEEPDSSGQDERKASARSLTSRQLEPSNLLSSQRLVDQRVGASRMGNMAVPRKDRWITADRNGDGKPTAATEPSVTSADSSPAASSGDDTSPDGTDS